MSSTKLWVIVAAAVAVVGVLVVWALLRPSGGGTASPADPNEPAASSAPTARNTTVAPTGKPSARPSGQSVPPSKLGTPKETGSGNTVSVEPVKTKDPVPLDDEGDFGTGLKIELTRIQSVKGEAKVPGEIAGPALKVTLRATNDSKKGISLDAVVVALSYGDDRSPAGQLSDGGKPLRGKLGGGDEKTGVYVYNVPTDQRDDVRVEVSYTGEAPTVAFEGSVD